MRWSLRPFQVGGAIESFGGYLYFGTMQVPGMGAAAFSTMYPNAPTDTTTYLDTYRAIAIFRTQGFDPQMNPSPSVELLYGSATLPQYDPNTDTWNTVPNNMGATPTYGSAGFGNLFNNYTWAMSVFQNQLYVGTMDWSFLATNGNESTSIPAFIKSYAMSFYGGGSLDVRGRQQCCNGCKHLRSRQLHQLWDSQHGGATAKNLWVGMANPMNLRTDLSDNPGGWKLINFPTQNGAPIITWYNPADIVYGTPLTVIQLNATSNVEGTFTYSPPFGAILNAGAGQVLSTTFSAFSSGNQYGKTVAINVLKAGTTSSVAPQRSECAAEECAHAHRSGGPQPQPVFRPAP